MNKRGLVREYTVEFIIGLLVFLALLYFGGLVVLNLLNKKAEINYAEDLAKEIQFSVNSLGKHNLSNKKILLVNPKNWYIVNGIGEKEFCICHSVRNGICDKEDEQHVCKKVLYTTSIPSPIKIPKEGVHYLLIEKINDKFFLSPR